LSFIILISAGCPATTQFHHKDHRPTDYTAHTLNKNEWRVGLGVVGTNYDTLGLSTDVRMGVMDGLEFGTNAAHDALGILNLDGKYRFVGGDWGEMALRAGIKWVNPSNIWILPEKKRAELGDINLIMIPLEIRSSFPINDWFGLHVHLGYIHSEIAGDVQSGSTLVNAGFGAREAYIQSYLTFSLWDKALLSLGAQVPVWGSVWYSGELENELAPGVVAGARTAQWKRLDMKELTTSFLMIESRFWESTYLRLSVVQGLRFLNKRVPAALPAAELYWRF